MPLCAWSKCRITPLPGPLVSAVASNSASPARALVNRPQLLLLDEPLSALDANLRKQMQGELKSLQREIGITFLFVTHDQEEAMALSDRIALLKDGALEQVATPRRDLYPSSNFVHSPVHRPNQFIARRNPCGIATCGPDTGQHSTGGGPSLFSLRPEVIRLVGETHPSSSGPFPRTIQQQIFSGSVEQLEVDCAGQLLRVRIPPTASSLVNTNSPFPGRSRCQ